VRYSNDRAEPRRMSSTCHRNLHARRFTGKDQLRQNLGLGARRFQRKQRRAPIKLHGQDILSPSLICNRVRTRRRTTSSTRSRPPRSTLILSRACYGPPDPARFDAVEPRRLEARGQSRRKPSKLQHVDGDHLLRARSFSAPPALAIRPCQGLCWRKLARISEQPDEAKNN